MNYSFKVYLVLAFITQKSICYPSASDPEAAEYDTQQQQTIDSESLEEFTKLIKSGGRADPEKLQDLSSSSDDNEDDACLLPKKMGPCKAAVSRFFFNKAEGKCQTFIYGGCGANKNNFIDLRECERTCAKHLPIVAALPYQQSSESEEEDSQEICNLPPVQGTMSCLGYLPRWTYDAEQKKCVQYVYGGCRGTKNLFHTKFQCESTCQKSSETINFGDAESEPANVELQVQGYSADLKDDNDACKLPKDSGPCYGLMHKYYFDNSNNRCEKFVFGGCGGNANRFDTAEDCMRQCGGHAPAEDPKCADAQCPWELYTHYTTLGCRPIYDGLACCPTRFDCPDRAVSTVEAEEEEMPRCLYKGKYYKIGDNVEEASDGGNCRAGCMCTEGPGQEARITCANIECPEHFGAFGKEKEGCVPLYKLGECCAYDFYCPNDTLIQLGPEEQKAESLEEVPFKCTVDGESFYEGQRFEPKGAPACTRCVCHKGFNGTLSKESCESIDCGIEIYYSDYLSRGCAPVYFQSADGTKSCCPISWECFDEMDHNPVSTSPPAPTRQDSRTRALEPAPITPGTAPPLVVPTASVQEVFISSGNTDETEVLLTQQACELPKEVGHCKGHRKRFYYNKENNTCLEFVYSGCGGNDNNFVSQTDCQQLCVSDNTEKVALTRSRSRGSTAQRSIYVTEADPCTEPKRRGVCKGHFARFYYDPELNSCQPFVYGGCRGNRNNFYTVESCEATCLNSIPVENLRTSVPVDTAPSGNGGYKGRAIGREPATTPVDICSLPSKRGRCKAHMKRFYFDQETQECNGFIYGGCGSNGNNFRERAECERRCKEKVEILPARGNSENNPAVMPASRRSGLRESGDGVSTQGFLEKCRLPVKSGSCGGRIPSYYYDAENDTCKPFVYTGCFGNANRFSQKEDCERECGKPQGAITIQNEGVDGRVAVQGIPWRPASSPVDTDEENSESSQDASNAVRPRPPFRPLRNEQPEFCKLDASPGSDICKGYLLRYYWAAEVEQCLPFIYSGCRGNDNNFRTETACLSTCGTQPTIEKLTDEGVLSCNFGNESVPVGATVRGADSDESSVCGSTTCRCVTPPSVTCVQSSCGPPTSSSAIKICPTPTCGSHCREAVGLDGCPTCDCDEELGQVQVEEIFEY